VTLKTIYLLFNVVFDSNETKKKLGIFSYDHSKLESTENALIEAENYISKYKPHITDYWFIYSKLTIAINYYKEKQ